MNKLIVVDSSLNKDKCILQQASKELQNDKKKITWPLLRGFALCRYIRPCP